jgi:hypothetical protein
MVGAVHYPVASIYPNWGNQQNQTDETQPDPSEHEVLGGAEGSSAVSAVDSSKSLSILALLVGAIAALYILGR